MRKSYELTDNEFNEFKRLHQNSDVWQFWMKIANQRDIDYKSIIGNISNSRLFTGLPLGHGKHWCYPESLTVPPAKLNS